jgi:hypothetical protein
LGTGKSECVNSPLSTPKAYIISSNFHRSAERLSHEVLFSLFDNGKTADQRMEGDLYGSLHGSPWDLHFLAEMTIKAKRTK